MQSTRAISMCALALAIALAIGAVRPSEQTTHANPATVYIFATSAPTPALPTPALAPTVEQLPLSLVEQPVPTAQVVYIEQPVPTAQVVYIEQPAQVVYIEHGDLQDPEPAIEPQSDPAMTPGTPEYQAALAEAYKSLPTIQCPCGVDPAPVYEPMTERQRQQSAARTR